MKILFVRKIQWLHQQIWVPWRYPKISGKESVRSELSNAVFENFLSFLKRKLKHFQTVRFLYEFYSKLCCFSRSLEKNTPKFRITIFHFKINPCVEMIKWLATRHSKAEKLNFVPRKYKCSLGNSRGLIEKSGYHAENPWKT